jgi:hypothetical protein
MTHVIGPPWGCHGIAASAMPPYSGFVNVVVLLCRRYRNTPQVFAKDRKI